MSDYSPLYLVKVEANQNNNKYYKMIPEGNSFRVEYGRIGQSNFQSMTYPIGKWESQLRSKLRKGYEDKSNLVVQNIIKTQKNRDYIDIPNKSIANIVERLQSMAKQAIKDNYKISSNMVTQVMIDEAQLALDKLLVADSIELFNEVLLELFKIIPRKMKKVADNLAKSQDEFGNIIQKEQDLLDVMKGQVVVQSQEIDDNEVNDESRDNPSQTILDALGLKFEEIIPSEIELIKHNLGSLRDKFYQGWKIINLKTQKKYDTYIKENNIKDERLLWHGSKNENFWSIINTGLILRPPAQITGKMFGFGCYFSPTSKKSFNYTSYSGSYWAKGTSNVAFMALFDVAYGKPYDVYSFDSKYYNFNYEELQKVCKGSNCLHAHKGSMLLNDEIIVYKEEQITIKYLIELR